VPSLHCARLKKPPHRLGGIPVLGDDRFERSLLAEGSGVFGTNRVEMSLVFVLGRTLRLDGLTQTRDLRGQAAGSLRDAFEFQSNLAALPAEGFRLKRGGCNLSPQTLFLAADKFFLKRSESSLSLGQLGFRGCRARDQFRAALFVGSNARLPTIAFD